MKFEPLARLISAADFTSFREIALRTLRAQGYAPVLTDGPGDGGADFRLYQLGTHPAPLAVQISVEADWKSKLREDAKKLHQKAGGLKLDELLYMTSRRIEETEFNTVRNKIRKEFGVRVERMDNQAIASIALSEEIVPELLSPLGIDVPATPGPRNLAEQDRRLNLAFSCALFGVEAEDFRRSVLDRVVVHELADLGGTAERDDVVARSCRTLGLDGARRPMVSGAVDRLIQRGTVHGPNGSLTLAAKELAQQRAAAAVQGRSRDELIGLVRKALTPLVRRHDARDEAARAILEDLGALLLEQGATTVSRAVFRTSGESPRERVRRLHATLRAYGVEAEASEAMVVRLVEVAGKTAYGKALVAGQMFISLGNVETPQLLGALGVGRGVHVLLDTSVAMPWLCVRLQGPVEQHFFLASQLLDAQLRAHDLRVSIPRHYVEEIASHLLDAWKNYRALVTDDPDPALRASENAFVAHFVGLQRQGVLPTGTGSTPFDVYLRGFDFDPRLADRPYIQSRDTLIARLTRIFKEYGIDTIELQAPPEQRTRAEREVDWALHDIRQERHRLLKDHDALTLAWAFDHEEDPDIAWIVCSWDRLHAYLREREVHRVDVFDPVTLVDLLSLAAPTSGAEVDAVSPKVIALAFTEEEAQRSAEVLDRLARIEGEGLSDGRLRNEARRFKNAWISRERSVRRTLSLPDAWREWKTTRLPSSQVPPLE